MMNPPSPLGFGGAGTIGWDYGFIALWGIHVLSVVAFFTGVLFFIILAAKTFNATQLRNWAIWLVIIGAIACLATIAVTGRPWVGLGLSRFDGMPMMRGAQVERMMDQMMRTMKQHDAGRNDPAHTQIESMMRQWRQDGRQGDLRVPSSSEQ